MVSVQGGQLYHYSFLTYQFHEQKLKLLRLRSQSFKKHTRFLNMTPKKQQKPSGFFICQVAPLLHKTLNIPSTVTLTRGKKKHQPLVYLFHAPRHVPAPSSGHKSQRIPDTKKQNPRILGLQNLEPTKKKCLVVFFCHPFEKYARQNWESSREVRVKINI